MRNGEKRKKTEQKKKKRHSKASLRREFLRLNSTIAEFTMRRNYLSKAGDCIIISGEIRLIPKAEASSSE